MLFQFQILHSIEWDGRLSRIRKKGSGKSCRDVLQGEQKVNPGRPEYEARLVQQWAVTYTQGIFVHAVIDTEETDCSDWRSFALCSGGKKQSPGTGSSSSYILMHSHDISKKQKMSEKASRSRRQVWHLATPNPVTATMIEPWVNTVAVCIAGLRPLQQQWSAWDRLTYWRVAFNVMTEKI
jgi:hypothetical protein